MDILYIVLRVLHIFGGIFWAGATTAFVLFVSPAAAQTAPESNKFMANLTTNQSLPTWLSAAAGVNVLAGITLFWLDSGGLSAAWFNRAYALSFTVGALAGLAAPLFLGTATMTFLRRSYGLRVPRRLVLRAVWLVIGFVGAGVAGVELSAALWPSLALKAGVYGVIVGGFALLLGDEERRAARETLAAWRGKLFPAPS